MGSLPTLNPPQPIDVGRLVQLKNLLQAQPLEIAQRQQALQSGQLGLQEQQMNLEQRQAINQAYKSAVKPDENGQPQFDVDGLTKTLAAAGHGEAIPSIMKGITDYQKLHNDVIEGQQKIELAARDSAGAAGYAITKANNDPGLADSILEHQLRVPGIDPSHAQQYQAMRQQMQQDPMSVAKIAQQLIANSPKYSELQTQEMTAQAKQLQASTSAAEFKAKLPGGPLEDPSKIGLQDYLKDSTLKGESLPLSKRNAATYEIWKAKLAPQAQITVANAAGGGLSDTATDQAAQRYLQTGQLPPGARGVVGLAQNRKIMNRAAELDPNASLVANAAINKSYSGALSKLQAQNSSVEAFEGTAKRNLQMLSDKIDAIPDLGTRFANVPLRLIQGKMIGDKAYAEMNAALLAARSETARVLSSASAAGAVPVEQQKEVQAALDGNMPAKTAKGVIQTFMQDMDNRSVSYKEQINDLQGRLKQEQGGGATSPAKITKGGFDWSKFQEHK